MHVSPPAHCAILTYHDVNINNYPSKTSLLEETWGSSPFLFPPPGFIRWAVCRWYLISRVGGLWLREGLGGDSGYLVVGWSADFLRRNVADSRCELGVCSPLCLLRQVPTYARCMGHNGPCLIFLFNCPSLEG